MTKAPDPRKGPGLFGIRSGYESETFVVFTGTA